jgi:hypothetical protein
MQSPSKIRVAYGNETGNENVSRVIQGGKLEKLETKRKRTEAF